MSAPLRLQLLLARAGVASRRAAENLIRAGRVRVNGRVVSELGSRADPAADHVEVEGHGALQAEATAWIALHKPPQVISSVSDPAGRPTVCDLIGRSRAVGRRLLEGDMPRLWPVGRLDWDAEGLVLMSNDGELAARLLHPRRHVAKRYLVKVHGRPSDEAVAQLAAGVRLREEWGGLSRPTLPALVSWHHHSPRNTWLAITLREGRNRQIKRMCEAVGHSCLRLVRTDFAGVALGALAPGAWRHLTAGEVEEMRRQGARPGLQSPGPAPRVRGNVRLGRGGVTTR